MANDIQSMKPNTAKIENFKTGKLTVEMADDDSKTVIDGGKIEAGAVHIPSVWVDHHFDWFHSDDPMVKHPAHYASDTLECIEWIESELSREEYEGYLKGNVLKYLWRYPDKGGVQDVEKAMWYLNELRDALRRWKLQEEATEAHIQDTSWRACEWECCVSQDELDELREWINSDVASSDYYSSKYMEDVVGRPIFHHAARGMRKGFWSVAEIQEVLDNPRVDCLKPDPYILYFPAPERVEALWA